jgi:hypothetical protein
MCGMNAPNLRVFSSQQQDKSMKLVRMHEDRDESHKNKFYQLCELFFILRHLVLLKNNKVRIFWGNTKD